VKIDVFEHEDAFDVLSVEWNDLLERSAMNTIFSTLEWQKIWWNVYTPGNLWIITCRDDSGHLMGIAPWFTYEGDQGKIVSAIGCVDVTDYLDVIIDKDCIEAVMQCYAVFLKDHQSDFSALNLCNIPEKSPTFSAFPEILAQHGFKTQMEQLDVAPAIQLPDEWAGYLSLLDKKNRHELRRKMRRANGNMHEVDWYIVDDTHDLEEQLELFITLMAASDSEKEEFLQDDMNTAFFRELIPVLFEKGWVQLNFLTVDGEAAAAYLNLDYDNQILVYNSGLLRGDHDHLSPGIILLAHNIRYAIDHKYQVFDFLRGDEPYKYHMGGKNMAVYALQAQVND